MNLDAQVDNHASVPAGGQTSRDEGERRLKYLPWLVMILVAIAFSRTPWFDFVNWDDGLHVFANPAVVGPGEARDRWLTPSLGYAIPVTVASYRLEYLLVGASPWLYHATNLLLHLGVCGLLYGLGRRLGLGRLGASCAMLFFGLHPVVAEPVSWVSGRKDLLAAVLGLAATWGFLAASARPERRARAMLGAVALFALAAFSKPSVLALPLAWLWLASGRMRVRCLLAVPAMAVALAITMLSWLGQSRVGAVHASPSPLVWAREVYYALGYHLGLAFMVQQPLAKHIPAVMPPWFDPAVDLFPFGVGLLAWLWLGRMESRSRQVARFGLLFAGMAYLPSSGIAPLTRYLADSYVYLPLAGLAWAVGASAETVLPRVRAAWRWTGGIAAVLALLLASSAASLSWHDGISLWQTVYQRYPDSPQVCLNLGNAHFELGGFQAALDIYERCSSRFGPDHFAKNHAISLFMVGRTQEARQLFQHLRARYPGDPVVHKYLRFLGVE